MPAMSVTLEEKSRYTVVVEAEDREAAVEAATEMFCQSEKPFSDFEGERDELRAFNVVDARPWEVLTETRLEREAAAKAANAAKSKSPEAQGVEDHATLLNSALDYLERYADLNNEPAGGDCRRLIASITKAAGSGASSPAAAESASAGAPKPAAQPLIEVIRNRVSAYDDSLNDDEQSGGARAPTGDDYNRLFEIIMSDLAPGARRVRAPVVLGKGPEQDALKVLEAFVSECGGNPPDWLREVFGQAEDVLEEGRRRTVAPAQPTAATKSEAQPLASLAENARSMEVIVRALRLSAPVAEDAVADIDLEEVPADPVEAAVQRQNRAGAQSALDTVRQALQVAEPWLEQYQRKNSLDQLLASVVERGLEWVERSSVADTDPPEYLALREAHRQAMGFIPPSMEVYEATARLNGWSHAGHHWWKSLEYRSFEDAQLGILYSNARSLCEAEDLDVALGEVALFSENCTFITDKFGDVPVGTKDVPLEMVERLRPLLNGENIRVAIKDGQIGLQIEEAFDFTALPLDARVGPELASARTRFPEAEIWLTKGDHIKGADTDVAMRAFIPATRVAEELVSELSDAIYCMVVDSSGTSFALSASASPSI